MRCWHTKPECSRNKAELTPHAVRHGERLRASKLGLQQLWLGPTHVWERVHLGGGGPNFQAWAVGKHHLCQHPYFCSTEENPPGLSQGSTGCRELEYVASPYWSRCQHQELVGQQRSTACQALTTGSTQRHSFHLHRSSVRSRTLLSLFCTWENSLQKSNLPEITQLGHGRPEIWTQVSSAPQPKLSLCKLSQFPRPTRPWNHTLFLIKVALALSSSVTLVVFVFFPFLRSPHPYLQSEVLGKTEWDR